MVRRTARAFTRFGPSNARAMIAERVAFAPRFTPTAMQAITTAVLKFPANV